MAQSRRIMPREFFNHYLQSGLEITLPVIQKPGGVLKDFHRGAPDGIGSLLDTGPGLLHCSLKVFPVEPPAAQKPSHSSKLAHRGRDG